MMTLFVGGPLDGQLREVGNTVDGFRFAGAAAAFDRVPAEYTIANGIARHESVSEEEVAKRVAAAFASVKELLPMVEGEHGYLGEPIEDEWEEKDSLCGVIIRGRRVVQNS